MNYNVTVNLGNISPNITHVNILVCTRNNCSNCTPLANHQNVPVGFFPMDINNLDSTITNIKVVVANGDCAGEEQCLTVNFPT